MKNKRGDIPVVILVIGVVMLCGIAIVSFFISDIQINGEPLGVGLMEEINADIEKFYFYLNLEDTKEEAGRKIGAEIENNFLIVKRSNNFISINYELFVP